MKKLVIITQKTTLSKYLTTKINEINHNYELSALKSIDGISDFNLMVIEEKIIQRGYKKEFRKLKNLKSEFPRSHVLVIGDGEDNSRIRCKIDGAYDYLSYSQLTSELLNSYFKAVFSDLRFREKFNLTG